MRRNSASSAGLWKIPHARRLRRPLAARRAAHPAAPGCRAGSLAEPIETTGFLGAAALVIAQDASFFFSFPCSPHLYEESFQQINEKLAMPVLLWGGATMVAFPSLVTLLCVL